jgi:hypothetical protein
MNQNICLIQTLWESSENNKSLGTLELNTFFNSITSSTLISHVVLTFLTGEELFNYIHIRLMVLTMYLGQHVQVCVHETYPATSKDDHTYPKHAKA